LEEQRIQKEIEELNRQQLLTKKLEGQKAQDTYNYN
jgi:hypothetical protein